MERKQEKEAKVQRVHKLGLQTAKLLRIIFSEHSAKLLFVQVVYLQMKSYHCHAP